MSRENKNIPALYVRNSQKIIMEIIQLDNSYNHEKRWS